MSIFHYHQHKSNTKAIFLLTLLYICKCRFRTSNEAREREKLYENRRAYTFVCIDEMMLCVYSAAAVVDADAVLKTHTHVHRRI